MNTKLVDKEILQSNINITKDKLANMELANLKDVELTNVADGQIAKYNATTQKWENKDAVNPTQFTVMPAPEDYPQGVVQFLGADTANYKRGYFYRSTPSVVSGEVVYNWVQIDTQPSNTDYEQMTNLPQINDVELVGDKSLDDLGIQGKVQFETLPTATAANVGKLIQFIGTTTSDYKRGFWYQSVYDSETAGYVWKNVDVSSNAQLENRINTLANNQGDMSALEVVGVSDIVSALNALNGHGLDTITYTEPNLILTYSDGSTKTFNVRDSILHETQIGELANVTDSAIADKNLLQYDSAILGYKPYDIVTALTNLLTDSKDYTDQQIASSLTATAFVCDAKPTLDAGTGNVIYFQNGVAHTTDKADSRFYYTTTDGSFCTSWIDGIEFTFNVATVDYTEFVSKTTDVVSTYTEDMADKSKVPNISALDALMALVKTALALKVNTSSIVDALTSQDATKVLSANQGYVINELISAKNDKLQFATMPSPASALSGIVYQYVGTSSSAFVKGKFYTCLYDNETDTWYWSEIKYSADTDAALDDTSENPVQNKVIKAALDDKQNSTLSAPIESQTTVEGALGALSTNKQSKTLSSTIEGETTVEGALQALSDKTVDVDGTTIVKDATTGELSAVTATNTTLGVVKGSEDVSIDANGGMTVNNRLEKISALPTASATNVGKIYLLTSNQTGYEKGGVYECQETSTDVYEWVLISTSPLTFNSEDFDVVDDEVSLDASQKIKTFTQAEWDALTSEEKIALAGQNVIITDDEGTQTFEDIIPSGASANNKLVTENSISTKVGAITGSGITYRTFTCTLSNATAGYQNHEFLLVTREENVLINARIHTDGTLNVTACDINGEANTITNIGYAFDNTTRTLTIGVTLASWAMTLSVVKITYPKDVASTPIVVSTLPTLTDVTIKKLVTESDLSDFRETAFKIHVLSSSNPMTWTQVDNKVALLSATISDGTYVFYTISTGWGGDVVTVKISGTADLSITRSGNTITVSCSAGTYLCGVFMTP